MKLLITALILTLSNTSSAVVSNQSIDEYCASIANYAEQVARARDEGRKAVQLIAITTNEHLKSIVLDSYYHRSYSPERMSNRWIVKCYKLAAKNKTSKKN